MAHTGSKGRIAFFYAAALVCLAYRVAAGNPVIQFTNTTSIYAASKYPLTSVASLPDDKTLIAGHKFVNAKLADDCLANVYNLNPKKELPCQMLLKDDKDIYDDVKWKKGGHNTTVTVARSKSYILLGMSGLPLQKKEKAGVAYFYEIDKENKITFMRSFNVTPDSSTNTGKFVAIGENYAAVYQQDKKHEYIHTFINTFGEWKDYDKLKIEVASGSQVVGITMNGFNLRVFTNSTTNNVILYEFRNGWKHAGHNTISLPEPTLFSSRGDDTLALSSSSKTINYLSANHDYTGNNMDIKNLVGVSYGYQNTYVYSYDDFYLTIFSVEINRRQNQYYIAEAFFETTQNSEFNAKILNDQIQTMTPYSNCTSYLDYFKQHYFRVYASMGYVCENSKNPLAKDITAAYENLRKHDLLLTSFDGSLWQLPTDYSSFHDQGKRMNGLILGYIAIGMAGPVVVLSFFWAILGFCIPSLRPKNRNRAANSEATGFIPPQA